ncbi:MarR family winged helix-turn-helix transcriptional regulator [Tundrisphaera sp. TA3]|uniref:MarR family winged helix-turn-helix transcriptional regulator n=1 Tax=Tundrisphaera sp. TA3 TaxID=3435775 RepID=UPI003EBA0C20
MNPELLDRIAASCTAVRVRLINRVVTALYDEALRPLGIRVNQANILVTVARLDGPRPVEVCRQLRIEKSTLSRDVEVMKRKGWITSDPPGGGRHQVLRLTAAGEQLLIDSLPGWERAQAEAARLIGEPGLATLRDIATRLGLGSVD